MTKKPESAKPESPAADDVASRTSWGDVAAWYDKLLGGKDTFQANVILPHLTRLLGIKKGMKLLDLACGQGFFSHALAAQGATVTGVDVAPELIALAKKVALPKAARPTFFVAPANALAPIKDASVDLIVIVLAIQNIEDVQGAFAECRRVLAPNGSLHLVLNHPSFRVPKGSSWAWDKNGSQYRRIDKYLTESKVRIQMKPGGDPDVTTVSFHRPLQFYVKALAKSGFALINLEEWASHRTSDSGPRAAEENRARNEIPMFMYLSAKFLSF